MTGDTGCVKMKTGDQIVLIVLKNNLGATKWLVRSLIVDDEIIRAVWKPGLEDHWPREADLLPQRIEPFGSQILGPVRYIYQDVFVPVA